MFRTLHSRLLLSYMAVIAISLLGMAAIISLILYNRALPVRQAYQRLSYVAAGVIARQQFGSPAPPDEQLDRLFDQVQSLADSQKIRGLVVERPDNVVLFDSAHQLPPGRPAAVEMRVTNPRNANGLIEGIILDGDDTWLFVAVQMPVAGRQLSIILEVPRPRMGILGAFEVMGENLMIPVLEAGCIGSVMAVLLAAWVARSVARPLQRMAEAATSVAKGDFSQEVPVSGPSEVRSVATAFNRMTAQVKRARQAQQDFLANISHELRTPLTSIRGFSQAIMDGTANTPELAAHVAGIIHEEAGRLSRMVDELLDLARIESGQMTMERERLDLGGIIRAVAERFSIRAHEAGISLEVTVEPLPTVIGDGDRLAQVLTNLIDNAIKYTPSGGTISVCAAPDGDGVKITVSDTGEGIPEEELPRLFERFYRVDKSRSRRDRGGVGLGLAISREIVIAHGGTIGAENVPGAGARFTVWLPAA